MMQYLAMIFLNFLLKIVLLMNISSFFHILFSTRNCIYNIGKRLNDTKNYCVLIDVRCIHYSFFFIDVFTVIKYSKRNIQY